MTPRVGSPRPLAAGDKLDAFACRSAEQTRWLVDHARQAHSSGLSKVLVSTVEGDSTVVAYYAWCMSSVDLDDVPSRFVKGAGRYRQPVALLARLGVDLAFEGQGLGAGLMRDVLYRAANVGREIGCRGLLIHTETAEARAFYQHLVPDFVASPTDDLHLFLLMKDLIRSLP